ncbi:hypothetical protein [Swingsia samuiensis]|uniref:Uncharacterized protein n=1 Tax=Swingsia samuiensis TaxID=1293412 RepID=A0A4Y6UKJ9_9PROT|nr:hypothetical protein [Swingsia samuiensis]QDH18103.1 hypothetical protein E3D00_10420 [Swingsia samuiensis]
MLGLLLALLLPFQLSGLPGFLGRPDVLLASDLSLTHQLLPLVLKTPVVHPLFDLVPWCCHVNL